MAKLLRGSVRFYKGGLLAAGSYIGAMVFTWLLANEALMGILTVASKPGLWIAEKLVMWLRAEQGVTWLAIWTPPDLSAIVHSPLGEKAISILVIGVLLNVVIYYLAGHYLARNLK